MILETWVTLVEGKKVAELSGFVDAALVFLKNRMSSLGPLHFTSFLDSAYQLQRLGGGILYHEEELWRLFEYRLCRTRLLS